MDSPVARRGCWLAAWLANERNTGRLSLAVLELDPLGWRGSRRGTGTAIEGCGGVALWVVAIPRISRTGMRREEGGTESIRGSHTSCQQIGDTERVLPAHSAVLPMCG